VLSWTFWVGAQATSLAAPDVAPAFFGASYLAGGGQYVGNALAVRRIMRTPDPDEEPVGFDVQVAPAWGPGATGIALVGRF
jgi:hypothetical protein